MGKTFLSQMGFGWDSGSEDIWEEEGSHEKIR